jgi:hypothetical protein
MMFRRIVCGLGVESHEPALGAALELAAALEARLRGVFVEDNDLLQLAALPFAHEVAFPGSARRAIDPESMARALRARAQAAQEALAHRLSGRAIEWTFEVVRGSAFSAVLEVTGESDLAVLSLSAGAVVARGRDAALRGLRGLRRPVLLVGADARPQAPLVAVVHGAAREPDTLAALGALAHHYGSAISIVAIGDGAEGRALRERFDALGIRTRVRSVPCGPPEALADAVAQERPGLVALCGDDAIDAAAEAVIGGLACPVMLLPWPSRAQNSGGAPRGA